MMQSFQWKTKTFKFMTNMYLRNSQSTKLQLSEFFSKYMLSN